MRIPIAKETHMTSFKNRNGDTLDDLHARRRVTQERLDKLKDKEASIMALLKPVRDSIYAASGELANIDCRLDIWRKEFNECESQSPKKP